VRPSSPRRADSQRLTSGPYRASVPAFIADQALSLSSELQALTEEAATELARFDVEVGHITAPFASILLRTESASSSEIENLTSGAHQIALAELGEHASRNARLIVGNVRAMQAPLKLSDAIDRLVDAEILTQITEGRRNRIWQAKDIVRVLDEFAARAKRRR
jgi:hypothetical protein